jgi:hypothetical protein
MFWTSHFKSLWLLHVDFFLQRGMGDVHRAKLKVLQGSQGKDKVKGGVANSGGKEVSLKSKPGLDLHGPSGANCMFPRGN